MGAILEQNHNNSWLPIAFASHTLTQSKQNYCQLEKETLSIVFACNKFHQYLYGRPFEVQNNHKPLKAIFTKPINKCPPRIQRFMLFLQKYDLHLEYIPGKEMVIADTLSRASMKNKTQKLPDAELRTFCYHKQTNQ